MIFSWHFHSHMAASGPGGWLCERQWPGGWALLQGLALRASRENTLGRSYWRVGQNSESLLDKITPSANFGQCLRIQCSPCSAHSPPASHRGVRVKLKVTHSSRSRNWVISAHCSRCLVSTWVLQYSTNAVAPWVWCAHLLWMSVDLARLQTGGRAL